MFLAWVGQACGMNFFLSYNKPLRGWMQSFVLQLGSIARMKYINFQMLIENGLFVPMFENNIFLHSPSTFLLSAYFWFMYLVRFVSQVESWSQDNQRHASTLEVLKIVIIFSIVFILSMLRSQSIYCF